MTIFATGLFTLYLLPPHPAEWNIIWRMALCGMGFGLFQTPNNVTIVSSAPTHRSGGASGMLGTARLLGQTLGTHWLLCCSVCSPKDIGRRLVCY